MTTRKVTRALMSMRKSLSCNNVHSRDETIRAPEPTAGRD
jgi:hypothetical protein